MSTAVVPARAGLVGHPSDGFGGAVLATPVRELAATVVVEPASELIVGDRAYDDLAMLRAAGHRGESMLLTAAVDRLASWTGRDATAPFALSWHTTIPRVVGLGGSSALVIGALRAVAHWWGVVIPDEVGPTLALEVETDLLGIAAGPQDRIVQWHDATVLMDFATNPWLVRALAPSRPIELFVCWADGASQPSQATHAPLRARRDEPEVQRHMAALAALARDAADAVQTGVVARLAAGMDAGFEHRRALVPLEPEPVAIIDALRALGAAATYAGSGGAVVALAPDLEVLVRWARGRGLGSVTTTLA